MQKGIFLSTVIACFEALFFIPVKIPYGYKPSLTTLMKMYKGWAYKQQFREIKLANNNGEGKQGMGNTKREMDKAAK